MVTYFCVTITLLFVFEILPRYVCIIEAIRTVQVAVTVSVRFNDKTVINKFNFLNYGNWISTWK